ncbi:MAG TPA: hypothetical protein VFE51_31535, partial [Verrucomicrobiae bacterium]|nr:hypothetical protein [Verrucomicrobiae bacterium]
DDARTNVPAGLTNVSAIAGGYFHDLALKTDGTVAAWGQNLEHQCDVPEGLSNVVGIAAGSGHSMALKNDGTVVAWGTQYGSTTRVPVGLTNVVSIDAGAHNNLALKADGTVVAWGEAYGGQSVAPTWLTNVVAISAGAGHDLALLADGTVIDWNDTTGALNPVPAGLSNAVAISAGELTSLALKADGTVIGWGTGLDMGGSLKIPADLTNAVGISIKWDHSLAMAADGSLVAAWGTNFSGESSVPARLPNVVAIAGGYYHSIALLRDGTPNLTVQPWDRWIRAGTSSAMSAKAVSREPISYQWQSNGTNIPGATTDTLKIANAQPTDTGVYNLAISNQIGTMTSRRAKLTVLTIALPGVTNHPPVLPAQVNWAVYEQIPVQIVNSATDPDGTTNRLTYQLLNPPTGATVDSAGVIRWTPSEEQGPGRIAITTVVTKQCNPPLSATNIFFISVNELNASPSLPLQPSRRIHPLTEMSVTNTGTDPDLPANILRYQLVLAPTGASIDNRGVIRWTPTREQAPSTNWFVTVITDNGQPNLSATNSFAAIVSAPVLSGQPDTTINAGQLLNVTNLAIDNDPVARLTFSLDAAPVGATISSEAGVFSWRAPVDRAGSSNYVLVRVTEDQVPISDARAFSVLVRPLDSTLLQPLGFSNGAFRLRLTGSIGPDYVLEASEGSADWAPLQTNTPNSLPFELIDTTAHSVTNRFYRVRLGP